MNIRVRLYKTFKSSTRDNFEFHTYGKNKNELNVKVRQLFMEYRRIE